MRIQPNNNVYSARPSFKADIDYKDSRTLENMNYLLEQEGNNAVYIYSMMQDLKKIDSDDTLTLSIESKYVDAELKNNNKMYNHLKFTVTNSRTGESMSFDQILNLFSGMLHFYISDSLNSANTPTYCEYPQSRAGEVLYKTIFCPKGLSKLFGLSQKQISEFKEPSLDILDSKIDTSDLDAQLEKLNQQKASLVHQREELRTRISEKDTEISSLLSQKADMKAQYVQSQLNLNA